MRDEPTDAELLRAAKTDPASFRRLYERYATRVHGFHRRRTGEDAAAHDLTAETFAQAWLSRGRFRDQAEGSAGPWLFAIARHVLAASVRRGRLERSARARLGLLEHAERRAEPLPEPAWLEGLDEAIAELPEGQRDAIALRVVGELDYEDVAGRLGITPQAARVRVHRGLRTLRSRLNDTLEASR